MSDTDEAKTTPATDANRSGQSGSSGIVAEAPRLEVSKIASVSVKAPPFWKANPALWFCQLEAQFDLNQIRSDKSKYHTVVAAIESTILHQVSDLVLNPPTVGLYPALKARLLEVFADSEQTRLKKLLGELQIADQKPSQVLREMRNLAGNTVPAEIVKSLWLQRLPATTQAILSVSTEDVDRLVVIADKIHETSISAEVHKIEHRPADNLLESQISELTRQIAELKSNFSRRDDQRSARPRSPSRTRSRALDRSRTPSRSRTSSRAHSRKTSSDPSLCWYHDTWGEKAHNCIGKCSFNSNRHSGN